MRVNMYRLGELPADVADEFVRCFDIRLGRKPHIEPVPGALGRVMVFLPVHISKADQDRARNYYLGFVDCRHLWFADVEKREAFFKASAGGASVSALQELRKAVNE